MVNFNGRVISDPDRFKMGKHKTSHIESVKTPTGNERVLNLNKSSKRNDLDAKLQTPGAKDIYLKVDQRQVIKLNLTAATTRLAFTQALRTAIDGPDEDLDIKYKASLIGVYKKLMSASHTPVPNSVALQNKEQGLIQKLQQRLPNSAHLTQLQDLMPHYASPIETLDKRLDHLFDKRGQIEASMPFRKALQAHLSAMSDHRFDQLQQQRQALGQNPALFTVVDKQQADLFADAQYRANTQQVMTRVWGDFIYDKYYSAIRQPSPLSDTSPTGYDDYYSDLAQIANNRPPTANSFLQYTESAPNVSYDMASFYQDKHAGLLSPQQLDSAKTDFFYFQAEHPIGPGTQRVYINVKADEAAGLMDDLVQMLDHPVNGVGINAVKVNGPESAGMRADSIVVYTASQAANDRVVQFLQTKSPNIFGSNTPELTESVFPGVATGDEVPHAYGGVESFGSLRSRAIAEALIALPPTATRSDFQALVEARLDHHQLDTNRVERNQ